MNTKLMTKAETAEALRKTPKQLDWLIYTEIGRASCRERV